MGDNIFTPVTRFWDYMMGNEPPKPAPKPTPKPAAPRQPQYARPADIPKEKIEGWLEAAGFNEMSVRRLMEVNPRIALMAVEAKVNFDRDPANQIKDKDGKVIGHKTFQIQHNGGYRTVRDQRGPTGSGNSQASPSRFQSHHQWGMAIDFWIYDSINGKEETPAPDTEAQHVYYERAATTFANTRNARAIGVTRDEMRIELNGVPDWGHIELPEKYRDEWIRSPTTGQVSVNGVVQRNTGIEPDLHPRPGPTYSLMKPS